MSELNFLQAIILSVIQAITEFIPVSSSAHLLLPSKLLGWPDQGQFFDISVHFGSLVAVILHFRDSLLSRNFYTSNFFFITDCSNHTNYRIYSNFQWNYRPKVVSYKHCNIKYFVCISVIN